MKLGKEYQVTFFHGNNNSKNKNNLFPFPLRCVIIGSSGCGKTTLLENFIYKHWINYDYLYVCSKSLEQEVYIIMKNIFDDINNELDEEIGLFFDDIEQLPNVDECKKNSLIIFDDCVMENQDIVKEYFVRGRHRNISCIYLTQCYSKLDRQLIRNNLNLLCIFKQSNHYVDMIYKDFTESDFELYQKFKQICNDCWSQEFGFISINLNKKKNNGKYMNKFENIINE